MPWPDQIQRDERETRMTRDMFARAAMERLLDDQLVRGIPLNAELLAGHAFFIANAMIAERNK